MCCFWKAVDRQMSVIWRWDLAKLPNRTIRRDCSVEPLAIHVRQHVWQDACGPNCATSMANVGKGRHRGGRLFWVHPPAAPRNFRRLLPSNGRLGTRPLCRCGSQRQSELKTQTDVGSGRCNCAWSCVRAVSWVRAPLRQFFHLMMIGPKTTTLPDAWSDV